MKTGYHAVYAENYFDGIGAAVENGFDFVQFELGVPEFFLDGVSGAELTNIRDCAAEKNVEITFHAPGDNVGLLCDCPLIRKGVLDQFALILEKAGKLNARHMTFHTGNTPRYKKSGEKTDAHSSGHAEYYTDILYGSLKYLTERGGDVLICVENCGLDRISLAALSRLMDENAPLYLTLDAAKMYKNIDEINTAVFDFYVKYKDRIREIHIHDMNRQYGQHQAVGTGAIDFNIFKQFLNENTYLNFEVRPVEAAKTSRDAFFKLMSL
ncbi:MAG: sugar phosphate isomerase/epimerase [Oscillospiraceae bacterium]|nr:sugar phosphate isomerase/epimerase [Oscillospiraceae bacterium]